MIACLADARYLVSSGRPVAATARLRLILATHPDNEEAWLWFAALQSDPANRRNALIQVLALNPRNPKALRGLAGLTPRQPHPYSLWHRQVSRGPTTALALAPRPRYALWDRYQSRPSTGTALAVACERPLAWPATTHTRRSRSRIAPRTPFFSTLLATACFVGALALGLEVGHRLLDPATAILQTALPRAVALLLP
ncbi:MAG: hypothetical protein M5U01_03235 [Ardenticatenaceae bacterium]|nr:hypothetical protein [Ardenticatenaceae bacterium]HBY96694.1 hypothetical protein [Chloroflexota bacterium]